MTTSRDRQRDANRAAHPEFAEFVDRVRELFGGCRVRWVRFPDGTEQGKRGDLGVALSIGIPKNNDLDKTPTRSKTARRGGA